MLEVVCEHRAVLNDGVGDDVVVVDLDVEGDVLLCEDLLCDLEDLGVRGGGGCNGDGSALECIVVDRAVEAVGGFVNDGDDRACVLVVYEICDLLALECCDECLDGVVVFVAFLNCEDVGVCRSGAFLGQCVLNGVEACVYCVVAVDDCVCDVGQEVGDLSGLGLDYLNIVRIVGDVVLGCGDACAVLEGDDAGLLQEQQRAGFVGGVVGNCYLDDVGLGVIAAVACAGGEAECENKCEGYGDYLGEVFHFDFSLKIILIC